MYLTHRRGFAAPSNLADALGSSASAWGDPASNQPPSSVSNVPASAQTIAPSSPAATPTTAPTATPPTGPTTSQTWAGVFGEVVRGVLPGVNTWVERELGVNQPVSNPQPVPGAGGQYPTATNQGPVVVQTPAPQPQEDEGNKALMIGVSVVGGLVLLKALKVI